MALVPAPRPYELTITLTDSSGVNKVTKRFELTSADETEAITDTAAILTRFQAVSDGLVLGYSINHRFIEDQVVLPTGVEIEQLARVSWPILDIPNKYAKYDIPAPKIELFKNPTGKGRNEVDPTNAALLAFLNSFSTGNQAVISDGEVTESASAANVTGKRATRGSTNG